MGRLKKITFQCQYCDKIFKRKYHYEIHLMSHSNASGQRRNARARSNWCHVCRQSFTPLEYKLHIRTEHQFDSHLKLIDDVLGSKSDEDIDAEIDNKKEYFSPNKNIKQEIDKNTAVKSPRKTALKLSSKLRTNSTCPIIRIKPELDNEALVTSPKKRGRKAKSRSPCIICDKCGMKCKNERGLKIHKGTIHKRNSSCEKHKTSPQDTKIQCDQPKQVLPQQTNQCINYVMPATNSQQLYFQSPVSSQNAQSQLIYNALPIQTTPKRNSSHNKHETFPEDIKIQCDQPKLLLPEQTNQYINYVTPFTNNQQIYFQGPLSNLNQNVQPQLIYNPYPIQQPLFMNNAGGTVNQPNKPGTQIVPIFMNQNPEIESIPTFSPDDEKYIKWLKNLIYRCKLHRYPLTPMLCKCLNHLNFEIANAMANPTGCMLRRSKQFYFKKIQTVISEIMLGQLRYSIHVVTR